LENKTKVIIVLVLVAVAYAFGRYMQPANIEIQTREVIKTVEVNKVEKRKIKVRIVRPDGTVEERWVEEDITVTQKENAKEKESSKKVTNQKTQWKVHALAGVTDSKFDQIKYGVQIERRIVGPIFLGAYGMQGGVVGLSIGMEF
jgi:hypothetical protein